uniref:Myelin protein zero like 2 n=1 Tax=Crocodylus porosus TaxID=8502 RepID=A0A7M4FNX8_CROPO
PEDKGSDESVFFYQGQPYPLLTGRFKDRVTWDGNIHKNDASIVIWNLKPTDNGTFTCQVKNPPDVSGTIGEIRLSVVQSGTWHSWTVTKVDWVHAPRNSTESAVVFYYYSGRSVPAGRARERVQWLGDVSRGNGSIGLQDLQEGDGGTYTCEIRVSGHSSIFKNSTALHVVPAARRRMCPCPTGSLAPATCPLALCPCGVHSGEGPVARWELGRGCRRGGWMGAAQLPFTTCPTVPTQVSPGTLPCPRSSGPGGACHSRCPSLIPAPLSAQKSIYSSIHCPGTPKAVCEAEQRGKAEATYVTMVRPAWGTLLWERGGGLPGTGHCLWASSLAGLHWAS